MKKINIRVRQVNYLFQFIDMSKFKQVDGNVYECRHNIYLKRKKGYICAEEELDFKYYYLYKDSVMYFIAVICLKNTSLNMLFKRIMELSEQLDDNINEAIANDLSSMDDSAISKKFKLMDEQLANEYRVEQAKKKAVILSEKLQDRLDHKKEMIRLTACFSPTDYLSAGSFMQLLTFHDIKVPLRTKGWIMNKLDWIKRSGYKMHNSNGSLSVYGIYDKLETKIKEVNNG